MRYYHYFIFLLFLSCNKDINKSTTKPNTPSTGTFLEMAMKSTTFNGYVVNPNTKSLGTDYWLRGTGVMNDLIIQTFQTPLPTNTFGMEHNYIQGGWVSSTCGDFNNDGFVDVFTPGAGTFIGFTFLVWDTTEKTFKEKNLLNDKSSNTLNSGVVKSIPIYLNDDNYVDIILIGTGEDLPGFPNVKIKLMISDGIGGYDIKEIETNESDVFENNSLPNKFGGDVGDLNGDGINDLVLTCGPYVYIYWGIKGFPYFKIDGHATFSPWYKDIGIKNNNSFGEKCVNCSNASNAVITDLNGDTKKDILLLSTENEITNNYTTNNTNVISNHRVLINQGVGRFNESSVINLPFYNNKPIENLDYIVDDLNGDGLMDIMASNHELFDYNNSSIFPNSDFFVYIKQKDGSYIIDKTWFNFSNNYNTKTITKWGKQRLLYYDYNNDGKKDITYIDGSEGNEYGINNKMSKKTVFIREGNQFVEKDIYQYDSYAKKLLDILSKRFK